MAPTPTILAFRNALIARLAGITTAGGYNFDPQVYPVELAGQVFKALPAIIIGQTSISEVVPGHKSGSRGIGEVVVSCRVARTAEAGEALSDALKLADDVMRRIHADPTTWIPGAGVGPPYVTEMQYAASLDDTNNTIEATVVVRSSLLPLF